jgi:hypothetical protein
MGVASRFRSAPAFDPTEKLKGRRAGRADVDEMLPEYDFSRALRNKYASRYGAGGLVEVLEPDVAAVCPSAVPSPVSRPQHRAQL